MCTDCFSSLGAPIMNLPALMRTSFMPTLLVKPLPPSLSVRSTSDSASTSAADSGHDSRLVSATSTPHAQARARNRVVGDISLLLATRGRGTQAPQSQQPVASAKAMIPPNRKGQTFCTPDLLRRTHSSAAVLACWASYHWMPSCRPRLLRRFVGHGSRPLPGSTIRPADRLAIVGEFADQALLPTVSLEDDDLRGLGDPPGRQLPVLVDQEQDAPLLEDGARLVLLAVVQPLTGQTDFLVRLGGAR